MIVNRVKKVPVVIQAEAVECGAANLAMIMAYYGKHIPLTKVREECGVSRDGTTAKKIMLAAQKYGLNAKCYKYETDEIMQSGVFPSIIHWNFNHFVVLCGFKGKRAVINDPIRGRITVSQKEFDESFTGVCIELTPGENFKKDGKKGAIADFVKRNISGAKEALALVTLTTVITSLVGIIMPAFTNIFVDKILTGTNSDWLMPLICGLGVVIVAYLIASWINEVYLLKADGKIAVKANAEFMWRVLRLPLRFYSQRMTGDIVNRKEQNENASRTLVTIFAPFMVYPIIMIVFTAVMSRYSVVLTALGAIAVVINLIISWYISKKEADALRVIATVEGKLVGMTIAGIESIESIKASGTEKKFFEKWVGNQANVSKERAKSTNLNAKFMLASTMISSLTNVFILMCGAWLCIEGQWTIGTISAFAAMFGEFMSPAKELMQSIGLAKKLFADVERVDDVMKYELDEPNSVEYTKNSAKLSGKVELKNITFGYSKTSEPLIKNFSLTIDAGKHIAIVGASGCGKSTIAKLVCGLYKQWDGEILFDGKRFDEINKELFISSVSMVNQNIVLFDDTIANNIKMWDRTIEDFEVILAANDADIYDDILSFGGGLNYEMKNNARNISGGQRQRIEIARALATDPTLIILDEATSMLDAETEHRVTESIRKRGITCITIAHRLSTIRECDEIIVMNDGEIAERGTHEQLYAKNGLYTRLVNDG